MFLLQLNYQITWGFIDTCQHFFFLLVNIILLAYKETKYLKTPKKMKKGLYHSQRGGQSIKTKCNRKKKLTSQKGTYPIQ